MWYIYIYTYTHIYIHTHTHTLSHQKNEILPFATTSMELESIMLSQISQSEKDNYHMISCVEFKKQNRIIGEGREK